MSPVPLYLFIHRLSYGTYIVQIFGTHSTTSGLQQQTRLSVLASRAHNTVSPPRRVASLRFGYSTRLQPSPVCLPYLSRTRRFIHMHILCLRQAPLCQIFMQCYQTSPAPVSSLAAPAVPTSEPNSLLGGIQEINDEVRFSRLVLGASLVPSVAVGCLLSQNNDRPRRNVERTFLHYSSASNVLDLPSSP